VLVLLDGDGGVQILVRQCLWLGGDVGGHYVHTRDRCRKETADDRGTEIRGKKPVYAWEKGGVLCRMETKEEGTGAFKWV